MQDPSADPDVLAFRFPDGGPSGGRLNPSWGFAAITLGHMLSFLRAHLQQNWEVLRHAQVSDPALGFLALVEKAGERGEP